MAEKKGNGFSFLKSEQPDFWQLALIINIKWHIVIKSLAGSTHPSSSPSSTASSFRYFYRLEEDPEASRKRPLADLPSFISKGLSAQRRG